MGLALLAPGLPFFSVHFFSNISLNSACIAAHEHFLASDALQGRGSATANELLAAEYIASELEQYRIKPGAGTGYIQTVQANVDLTKLAAVSA